MDLRNLHLHDVHDPPNPQETPILPVELYPYILQYADEETFGKLALANKDWYESTKTAFVLRQWFINSHGKSQALFEAICRHPRFSTDAMLVETMIDRDKCSIPRHLLQKIHFQEQTLLVDRLRGRDSRTEPRNIYLTRKDFPALSLDVSSLLRDCGRREYAFQRHQDQLAQIQRWKQHTNIEVPFMELVQPESVDDDVPVSMHTDIMLELRVVKGRDDASKFERLCLNTYPSVEPFEKLLLQKKFSPNQFQDGIRAVKCLVSLWENSNSNPKVRQDIFNRLLPQAGFDATFWNLYWDKGRFGRDAWSTYLLDSMESRLTFVTTGRKLCAHVVHVVMPIMIWLKEQKCRFKIIDAFLPTILPCVLTERWENTIQLVKDWCEKMLDTTESLESLISSEQASVIFRRCLERMILSKNPKEEKLIQVAGLLGHYEELYRELRTEASGHIRFRFIAPTPNLTRPPSSLSAHPLNEVGRRDHLEDKVLVCFLSTARFLEKHLPTVSESLAQHCFRLCLDNFYRSKASTDCCRAMTCIRSGARFGKEEVRNIWTKSMDYQRGLWPFILDIPASVLEPTARSLESEFLSQDQMMTVPKPRRKSIKAASPTMSPTAPIAPALGNASRRTSTLLNDYETRLSGFPRLDTETLIKQMLLHGITIQTEKIKQDELGKSWSLMMELSKPPMEDGTKRHYEVM